MPSGADRPLAITGAIAACASAGTGLAVLTMLALAGWIAAPHAGLGLTGVLRTAALLWLIGHHVGFALPGAGRIGMLPLGLVLLPGALLWRAGRWVVRTGGVTRLRYVGYAALALAVPYAMVAAALALASSSSHGHALAARGGGVPVPARADRPAASAAPAPSRSWSRLVGLLPDRVRALTVGTAGALAVLVAVGALLAGVSLALHLREFRAVDGSLAPGAVGAVLLLLAQLAYVPNAIAWAISFTLGPGFAFGTGTVIAPTGSALGPLPAFPMLAALPPGCTRGSRRCFRLAVLIAPYLAGAFGGLLMARARTGARAGDRAAAGVRLRRSDRMRARGGGRGRGRPAGRRSPGGGWPVGMAGRRRGGARGGRGGRGDRRLRELAAAARHREAGPGPAGRACAARSRGTARPWPGRGRRRAHDLP